MALWVTCDDASGATTPWAGGVVVACLMSVLLEVARGKEEVMDLEALGSGFFVPLRAMLLLAVAVAGAGGTIGFVASGIDGGLGGTDAGRGWDSFLAGASAAAGVVGFDCL